MCTDVIFEECEVRRRDRPRNEEIRRRRGFQRSARERVKQVCCGLVILKG